MSINKYATATDHGGSELLGEAVNPPSALDLVIVKIEGNVRLRPEEWYDFADEVDALIKEKLGADQ